MQGAYLVGFLSLFVWHEIEEYRVLLPWVARNRDWLKPRLLTPARTLLNLDQRGFIVIAVEQGLLITLLGVFFPAMILKAALCAYALHLVFHCNQMLVAYLKDRPFILWSAPIQLPIVAILAGIIPGSGTKLAVAFAVMTVIMIFNLVVMHALARKLQYQ